jgi:hypothetical protein
MPAAFPYPAEVEKAMQVMYRSLRENDRRRYAAIEVAKLGHGGTDYIAALLDCDPKTRVVSWHAKGIKFFIPNPCRRKSRGWTDQRQQRECRLWTDRRGRCNHWPRNERLAR